MWVPILEKAWAKVKGSYETSNGGYITNGFRTLVGAPVFKYDNFDNADQIYDLMK